MSVFPEGMHAYMCVPGVHGHKKKVSELLWLELHIALSHDMGTVNLTHVLCKSNECS